MADVVVTGYSNIYIRHHAMLVGIVLAWVLNREIVCQTCRGNRVKPGKCMPKEIAVFKLLTGNYA